MASKLIPQELEALRAKQAEMEKDAQQASPHIPRHPLLPSAHSLRPQLMALQAALSGGGAPAADSAAPSAEASSSTAGVKEEGGGAGSAGDAGGSANGDGAALPTEEEREEVDARSIYIGNVRWRLPVLDRGWRLCGPHHTRQVDYGATPEEIQKHFQACGTINRVTILCDKFTGHPKGWVPRSCHPTGDPLIH